MRILKAVSIFMLLALSVSSASAQSISPVIQEVKGSTAKPAKGQFTVSNLSVMPLTVTLEIRSLDLKKNGDVRLLPLDTKVTVKLSEYSFRIPAKADHVVYFESSCDGCVFSVYSSMVTGRTPQGIQVAIHLPETIYQCADSAKKCRTRIRREQFGLPE
jgi:hypothetical protein